jgi:hypothetical protein
VENPKSIPWEKNEHLNSTADAWDFSLSITGIVLITGRVIQSASNTANFSYTSHNHMLAISQGMRQRITLILRNAKSLCLKVLCLPSASAVWDPVQDSRGDRREYSL